MKPSNLLIYPLAIILLVFTGCKKDESYFNRNINSNDFLSSKDYEKLVVEIQYVSGFQPKTETVNNLKALLEQRLNKPGGITIVQREIASPGKTSFTIDDIRNIEYDNRTEKSRKKTIAAYFLFLNGEYAYNLNNSKVLGVAYGASSMAIFEKTIHDYSGGISEPTQEVLETTVVNHEFGHILGLVNNGTSMVWEHQDEGHGSHCDNQNCLMYYSAETSDIVGNLIGGNIPQLDDKCIQDLRANGGK